MRKVIKRIFQGEREKKNEDSVKKKVLSLKQKTKAKVAFIYYSLK